MSYSESISWSKIGVYSTGHLIERIHHAGLSEDGRFCFIASFEEELYLVWDIREAKTIWVEDGEQITPDHPDLQDWINSGYIEIDEGPATGRYRIFGLFHNYPLSQFGETAIKIDKGSQEVILTDASTGHVLQRLRYEASSGDWAFASFSDNGSVIAVVEPYYVTFFGRQN
jgi:hypothetical protein